jgi:hypothetical protein
VLDIYYAVVDFNKNETCQGALLRIAEVELWLSGIAEEDVALMGMWDYFYSNSTLDQNISTYFENLPHYAEFKSKLQIVYDNQHGEFKWFDLSVVSNDEKSYLYVYYYAIFLLNRKYNTHD